MYYEPDVTSFILCNNVLTWLYKAITVFPIILNKHNRHNKYITPIQVQYTQTYKHFDNGNFRDFFPYWGKNF